MLRDTALIPSEAVRLAALGILAQGPRRYAELAAEVRHFVSRMVGPSLDLMGSSLELLRHEGLIERENAAGSGLTPPDAELRITEAGRRETEALLLSPLRGPINDFGKLVIALKLRFLDLLAPADRKVQIDLLVDIYESEVARLRDLRQYQGGNLGNLEAWINHEI